jgi:hypothetical protein
MAIVRITNRIIADSVPAIPRPVVRRIAGRYMRGRISTTLSLRYVT